MAAIASEELKLPIPRQLHIYDAYIGGFPPDGPTLMVKWDPRSTVEIPIIYGRSIFPQTFQSTANQEYGIGKMHVLSFSGSFSMPSLA